MSLRAIKKRENQQNPTAADRSARQTLFKKSTTSPPQRRFPPSFYTNIGAGATAAASTLSSVHSLAQQHYLLGRSTHSNPELRHPSDTLDRLAATHARLVRTKSESDVTTLLSNCIGNAAADSAGRGLITAKSEVCLQTISTHSYNGGLASEATSPTTIRPTTTTGAKQQQQRNMISGARSHRDLTQSAYAASSTMTPTRRRMSECSSSTGGDYSQRTSAMSASALTLSSAGGGSSDPNVVVRVPIIGYEVMEERARFTVYKLRVENPHTNDCWLVLRRYTDFVRLNTKLKQLLPHMTLLLPRKKIFGDNFNSVFLDNRVQGLQMFVNSIMSKEELRKCKIVREFFCLDEPPTYSESMEECRAIFEAQEETIAHLKLQINNKNDLILSLQQKLRDEILEKEQLKGAYKNMTINCSRCSSSNGSVS